LIGYFEGIGAERGIAWRMADSLGLRRFVGIALDEDTPDHSTISRTRRLIDLETHAAVFAWVLEVLARRGLIVGFVNLIWPLLMVSFGPTLKACDLSFRVGLGGRSP
jgi:hypothetical protein